MAKFPALPLWTDAYLSDTHPSLSLEEHGCYLLLLMTAWRRPTVSLPDDDRWICKTLAIDPRIWNRLRRTVLKRFWTLDNREWRQERLTAEADFLRRSAEDRAKIGRSNAISGWAKRNKNKGNAHATAMLPTPTPIKKEQNCDFGLSKKAKQISGVQPTVAPSGKEFVAPPDSPEFAAWAEYYKTRQKFFYNYLTETLAPTASFTFESQWPPGFQPNGKAAP
jgi:uncharacterized protein YdaU (DUF1376 family)